MVYESNYFVDIWFCYGSFFYGFESILEKSGKDFLTVRLITTHEDEYDELEDFIEKILNKKKGLILIELRIYEKQTPQDNFLIRIFTENIPKIKILDSGETILEFVDIYAGNEISLKKLEQLQCPVDEITVV